MAKKALCVGINDYPQEGSDLKGCVNDAKGWAALLTDHFDFAGDDVKLVTDAEATKENVVAALQELLADAASGDVLVFTNSSHGTYVAESGGDEPKYDEAMCPYDIHDSLLVDDELRELLATVAEGVNLTVISDSCFSGTVTRAPVAENIPGLETPDDRRVRFFSPALRGGEVLANPWAAKPTSVEKYPEDSMNHVLLSGCTDREYSYDARIEGDYHGAMSYYAIQAITEADYKLTWSELHERLLTLIDEAQYNQHPRLEGPAEHKGRQIFG
ncbi:hypothetical protein BH18ACT4_BH18ACT4_07740 [soil metagenome]